MSKNPTSFRLNEENLAKLRAISKRKDLSLNKILNNIISEYDLSKEGKKHYLDNDELHLLKREFSSQRQRINVLKNQVDFLIRRTKNAKK